MQSVLPSLLLRAFLSAGIGLTAVAVPVSTATAATVTKPVYQLTAPGSTGSTTTRYVKVYTTASVTSKVKTTLDTQKTVTGRHVFKVIALQGDWAQVQYAARPNQATGWIPKKGVALYSTKHKIRIDLAAKRLTVTELKTGKTVLTTPVAVGASKTPTPTGTVYVTSVTPTPRPSGAYGPVALGLAMYSNVLQTFGGGPGQIGIHGTNVPASIGTAASHGCIRVPNAEVIKLGSMIIPGTPVEIV